MKFCLLLILTMAFSAQAGVIEAVKPYLGKTGTGTEMGGPVGKCHLELDKRTLSLEGGYYFGQFVETSAKEIVNNRNEIIFLSDDDGRRIGGDQCGDWGGMTGYKQVLKINKKENTVSIIRTFRCADELFKKTTLEWACKF